MKKIISLLMAVTLLLCAINVQISAATPTEDSVDSEAMSFLKRIGVIDISNDEMKKSVITREDFAVYLANALGVETEVAATQRYYTDVAMTSYGAKAIESLAEMGIISRSADEKFRPDDNIAYEEVIKMLCVANGYGAYAEAKGGYPLGYMKTARENKFAVAVADENAITVREAAELIYEAIQVNMYEPISFGSDNVEYTASAGNTILSLYHKIYFDKGTVTGVYGKTINFDTIPDKGYMSIDGESFYGSDEVNKDEYLGNYVKYFYVKEKSDSHPEVIFVTTCGKEEVRFEIRDFVSYEGNKISYVKSDNSGKIESKGVSNPDIIYNGYPVKTDIKEIFDGLNKGYISVKDSNNDNIYDLILIDDYETVVVSRVDTEEKKIYSKSGDGRYIDLGNWNAAKFFDDSMNPTELGDIKQNAVLSVARTKDGKGTITAIVSNVQLNGVIDNIKEGTELAASINGVDYIVDKKYKDDFKAEVVLGNNYYYRCDFMGDIVYLSSVSADTMKFAYVIKAICIDDTFNQKVVLKVLNPEGEITDISFAKNIKVDGKKYKDDGKMAYNAFLALGGGKFKEMMIRYALDENGDIKEIDTPFLNEEYENDKSSLTSVYGNNDDFTSKYYRDYRLGLKAYMTTTTPIYCVPNSPVYGEIEQSEVAVQPLNASNVMRIDAFYPSNAYTTNVANEFADVVAVRYNYQVMPSNSYDRPLLMVDEINQGVNQNGDIVRILCGYTGGQRVEYEIDDRIDLGDVEQGDLIQLNYNIWGNPMPSYTDGQSDVVVLYDYSLWQGGRPDSSTGVWKGIVNGGRCYLNNGASDSQYYNYNTQLSFGFANECVGNTVRFGYNSGNDFDEAFRTSGISVIVYDASQKAENRVYVGSVNDIVTYKQAGSECSSVLAHTYHSQAKHLFVYR